MVCFMGRATQGSRSGRHLRCECTKRCLLAREPDVANAPGLAGRQRRSGGWRVATLLGSLRPRLGLEMVTHCLFRTMTATEGLTDRSGSARNSCVRPFLLALMIVPIQGVRFITSGGLRKTSGQLHKHMPKRFARRLNT